MDLHPNFPNVLCDLSAIWYTGSELVDVSPALLFEGFLSSLRCLLDKLLAFHIPTEQQAGLDQHAVLLECAPLADSAQC
jgi:hypothetical protein